VVDGWQTSFDEARAEIMRKRARWYAVLVLALWVPLSAFADPPSFGSVRGGLPYRIPTAIAMMALWLWLRRSRARWPVEVAATLAFSFLFGVWGLFVLHCSVETTVPAMLSIVLSAMAISTGLLLSWQGTATHCFVANIAMLVGGLVRHGRPTSTYFYIIATAFIVFPLLIFNAGSRDRRQRAELESQEKLRELNEQLRREQEARSRLFVNLSHDFRTPLAVVRAEVELLRKSVDGQHLQRALDRIDTNAGAIVELIEQLLELARLDAAKTPLSPCSCDLHAVAREVMAQLQPSRVDVEVLVHAPEQAILALIDPMHLRRILQNLLGNALRQIAGRGGRVTLTIAVSASGSPFIDVSDDGPGVPAELRERLFERFASFRPEGSTVSGIGLALARELAELNGGTLELLEAGSATTFRLSLSVADADARPPEAGPSDALESTLPRSVAALESSDVGASELSVGDAPSTSAGSLKPRVLVVEDNADLRSSLERLLSVAFEVHAVSSLVAAMAALSHSTPAAILTDIMLGDGDGYQLLAAVRLRQRFARVPVILLSALGEASERARGLSAGADDYVTKPFSGEELIARLRSAIRRSDERSAALERQRDDMLTELHDGVCGNLAHAILALGKATARDGEGELLASATASVREGLREARELLAALGNTSETLENVVTHLRWETAFASDRAGIELEFSVQRDADAADWVAPAALHALRRVTAEAIANAARHGSAALVSVRFTASSRDVRILVEDDGGGNTRSEPQGHGLSGIQRRVTQLGGGASFGDRASGGFFVEAWLPSDLGSELSVPCDPPSDPNAPLPVA
jgi:signal transduction histidine kinase